MNSGSKYRRYTDTCLRNAVTAMRNGKSISEASMMYNIPRSTLGHKMLTLNRQDELWICKPKEVKAHSSRTKSRNPVRRNIIEYGRIRKRANSAEPRVCSSDKALLTAPRTTSIPERESVIKFFKEGKIESVSVPSSSKSSNEPKIDKMIESVKRCPFCANHKTRKYKSHTKTGCPYQNASHWIECLGCFKTSKDRVVTPLSS